MNSGLPVLALTLLLVGCSALPRSEPATAQAAPQPARSSEAGMQASSERYVVVTVANPLERVPSRAGTSLSSYGGPPRYTQGSQAAQTLAAIARDHQLREAAAWPIPSLGVHCVVFQIADGAERDLVVAQLRRDERVRLAQPLQDFSMLSNAAADAEISYNDPYLPLQKGFASMNTARAHRLSTGRGAHIAVIDTGAQTGHPDLRGRIQTAENLVDADRATFEQDRHGTEVVGIIAATGNNGQGIVGIAPDARISLYKACWYPATPAAVASARCNSFTLAKALAAVMATDARILNLSLGGPDDPLLAALLTQLIKQDRIVIAAEPPQGGRSGFPANVPGVITVGMADASPIGPGHSLRVPGRDVLTLAPRSRYDFSSGSSMAAAHVSGLAALLQAAAPGVDRHAVETILGRGGVLPDALLALDALTPKARRLAER